MNEIANGIIAMCGDKSQYISNLLGIMECPLSKGKVKDLLNNGKQSVTLCEARLIMNINDAINYIGMNRYYELFPQLFSDINIILCNGVTVKPGSIRYHYVADITRQHWWHVDKVDESILEKLYTPTYYNRDNLARMYAQCIIHTMYSLPYENFSLATTVLGISCLMVWDAEGYCDISIRDFDNLTKLLDADNVYDAENYIMEKCLKYVAQ